MDTSQPDRTWANDRAIEQRVDELLARHYVGYGAAEAGRDYNSAYIPERLLREAYMPPFKAAVDAGAATIMSGYHALNDLPASANRSPSTC